MPDPSLDDFKSAYEGLICRWCYSALTGRIDHYTHPGGWMVANFEMPQWISMTCVRCGYQWSYRHVPRLRRHTEEYWQIVDKMRQELRGAGVHVDEPMENLKRLE